MNLVALKFKFKVKSLFSNQAFWAIVTPPTYCSWYSTSTLFLQCLPGHCPLSLLLCLATIPTAPCLLDCHCVLPSRYLFHAAPRSTQQPAYICLRARRVTAAVLRAHHGCCVCPATMSHACCLLGMRCALCCAAPCHVLLLALLVPLLCCCLFASRYTLHAPAWPWVLVVEQQEWSCSSRPCSPSVRRVHCAIS
jgi:hypothetical protein